MIRDRRKFGYFVCRSWSRAGPSLLLCVDCLAGHGTQIGSLHKGLVNMSAQLKLVLQRGYQVKTLNVSFVNPGMKVDALHTCTAFQCPLMNRSLFMSMDRYVICFIHVCIFWGEIERVAFMTATMFFVLVRVSLNQDISNTVQYAFVIDNRVQ